MRKQIAAIFVATFVVFVVPARASFIDALLQGTDQGSIQKTRSSGTVGLSHTGPGYFSEAQTSYGVNKVLSQTTTGGFAQNTSTWAVDFNLIGAPNTLVDLKVNIAYDFNISAANGAADWGIGFSSYETNFSNTGAWSPFGLQAYTDSQGYEDHSWDRPNLVQQGRGGTGAAGEHAGILAVDLPYYVGNNLTLRVAVSSSSYGIATSDGFNTARVIGITLPQGISWTYGSDVSGNPLHVNAPSPVPEPSTFALAGLGGLALMIGAMRRRRALVA